MAIKKENLLIFLNPTAGSGRAGLFYPYLKRILSKRQILYTTVKTTKKGDINGYFRSFKDSIERFGFSRIIAMGGDGTTWETISSLMEQGITHIPVSFFPFGSGNDLARSLNIPLYNPKGALETVLSGELDHLDICNMNGYYFANYLAFGFEGEVVQRRELEKTTLPGYTSYVKPFLNTVENLKYNLYHLKFDGHEIDVIGLTCIISNIPSHYGGVKLVREASFNDGFFEVTVIKKVPSIRTFLKLPFLHGKALAPGEFVRYRTNDLTVSFDESAPGIQADGENFQSFDKEFRISIDKRALPIIKRS